MKPGTLIVGKYRLVEAIAEGSQGAVFRAVQEPLGREVAVKLLRPESLAGADAIVRFTREATLVQRLEHPNTVRLFDFGTTEEGLPFIVFEHLRGRTLEQEIAKAPLVPLRVARITQQVLKSLMEAHALGLVHRDIKPSNLVLVDYAGETDFVKVLDFGVARPIAAGSRPITRQGELVGTPSYMAPEQVQGGPLGPATDLYSLGLVMAEALTGRMVYGEGNAIQIWMQQSSSAPVPLPPSTTSSVFGPILRRATSKLVHERYPSAQAMLADVERAIEACMSPTDPLATPLRGDRPAAPSLVYAPTAPMQAPLVRPSPRGVPLPAATSSPRRGSSRAIVFVAVGCIAAAGVALLALAPRRREPEHTPVLAPPNVPPSAPLSPTREAHLQSVTPHGIAERMRALGASAIVLQPRTTNSEPSDDVRALLDGAPVLVRLYDRRFTPDLDQKAAIYATAPNTAVARGHDRLLVVHTDGHSGTAAVLDALVR